MIISVNVIFNSWGNVTGFIGEIIGNFTYIDESRISNISKKVFQMLRRALNLITDTFVIYWTNVYTLQFPAKLIQGCFNLNQIIRSSLLRTLGKKIFGFLFPEIVFVLPL